MLEKIDLNSYLSKGRFSKIETAFKKNFGMDIETTDTDGKELAPFCSKNHCPQFCSLVRSSQRGFKRCLQDRLRSLTMAFETGQPYISICHAGIVLVCVPIMEKDIPLGGMFFGKCLYDKPNEHLTLDIIKRLKGVKTNEKSLRKSIVNLPIVPGRMIHQAAEFLFIILYEISGLDPLVIKRRREKHAQQSHIGEHIAEQKKLGVNRSYPLESEKELINKVKIGDKTGAKEILNNILGTIMFQDPGDLNVLKARLIELLSVLGRAAAEGGVNIDNILTKNLENITSALKIDNQADLCAWLSKSLNEFIEMVYLSQKNNKLTQINPAVEYIEQHYDEQLNLNEIAKSAHLSVSRLAHIFKEQTGITMIDYLTKVRIEKAKQLLLSTNKNCTEICFGVGYNNQSYFTRTFKKLVKMTPRKFREENQRNI